MPWKWLQQNQLHDMIIFFSKLKYLKSHKRFAEMVQNKGKKWGKNLTVSGLSRQAVVGDAIERQHRWHWAPPLTLWITHWGNRILLWLTACTPAENTHNGCGPSWFSRLTRSNQDQPYWSSEAGGYEPEAHKKISLKGPMHLQCLIQQAAYWKWTTTSLYPHSYWGYHIYFINKR